jgi:hypothetical protein
MNIKRKEGLMNKGRIVSVSPVILVCAVLIRLGWLVLLQFPGGFTPADLCHFWLLQLVIGG